MCSSCRPPARPHALKICIVYSCICLLSWPLSADTARLRCGSDLLSDLIFVCGDRGIYVGKGSWSGYGARPRGKGIVDLCCRSAGCELHHLEMYCAKPKSQKHSADSPSTTTASLNTTTQSEMFRSVFQRKLFESLGPPDSPQRDAYRRKRRPSLWHKVSLPHKRTHKTNSQPQTASESPFKE